MPKNSKKLTRERETFLLQKLRMQVTNSCWFHYNQLKILSFLFLLIAEQCVETLAVHINIYSPYFHSFLHWDRARKERRQKRINEPRGAQEQLQHINPVQRIYNMSKLQLQNLFISLPGMSKCCICMSVVISRCSMKAFLAALVCSRDRSSASETDSERLYNLLCSRTDRTSSYECTLLVSSYWPSPPTFPC